MKFLGNVFTNFIFEKFFSHEALVMGRITATSVSSYTERVSRITDRTARLRLMKP